MCVNKKNSFFLFNFEITSYCNAECPSCFRTVNEMNNFFPKNTHLKIKTFEDMILSNLDFFNFLRNNKQIVAKFCGEYGDPLMHPQIETLISIANQVFDWVEVFTNGGLRNPKWMKKVLSHFDKLCFRFAIDGLTDEINQIYRKNVNTTLAFDNMIECVKYGSVFWDYTVFSHNYFELNDVILFAEKHNLDLNVRFNKRPFNKISDKDMYKCVEILKSYNVKYY